MADISKIKLPGSETIYNIKDTTARSSINDGTLTMQVAGTTKATFTANDADNITFNVTAADLGLSQALIFKGITTTDLKDGDTTSPINLDTDPVTTLTPEVGNVVITKSTVTTNPNTEFVWANAKWNKLGDAKSYALSSITITGNGALGGGGDLTANREITHNVGNAASQSSSLYKFSTDAYSHINTVTEVVKSDITALGIPEADTNQTVKGNGSTFGTNAAVDIVAGDNVTVTADTTNNTITIAAEDGLPSQSGMNGKFLTTDGTNASWATVDKIEVARASVTATEGQSVITIPSSLGLTNVGGLAVYQNGLLLEPGINYDATLSAITLIGYTAQAGDIFTFVARIDAAGGSYFSAVETTGTGNAITALTGSGATLTATKGATFLTSHQDITGKQDKLTVTGSATKGIYVSSDGVVSACTYSVEKDVPSDAVFTDTHYEYALNIQGNGTTATAFTQNAAKTLNIVGGTNVSVTAATDAITIAATDTVTTATTTGSGNAVTSIEATNGALTVTKGSTFQTQVAALGSESIPVYTSAAGTFAVCTSNILGYPTASSFGTTWNTEYRLGSVSSCSLTLPSPVTTMSQEIRITFVASAAFTPAFTAPSGYTLLGTSDLSATTSGSYYEISCACIDSSHIAIAMKEWS